MIETGYVQTFMNNDGPKSSSYTLQILTSSAPGFKLTN
jgi:hypothetical protein